MFDLRKILKVWNNQFPDLRKYTDRTIFINIKPFLLGLRLMKSELCEEYRVYFEVYPLWRDKEHFFPLISEELKNERGVQIFIRWRAHEEKFPIALRNVKRIYGNLLKKEVTIQDFIDYMLVHKKEELRKNEIPIWQIPIYEIFFALALYYDNSTLINYSEKLLNKEVERWRHLKIKSGGFYYTQRVNAKLKKRFVPFSEKPITYSERKIETYKNKILEDFRDRDKFIAKIEENCKHPKIAKLNVGEFVGVDEFEPQKSFWEKVKSVFRK